MHGPIPGIFYEQRRNVNKTLNGRQPPYAMGHDQRGRELTEIWTEFLKQ